MWPHGAEQSTTGSSRERPAARYSLFGHLFATFAFFTIAILGCVHLGILVNISMRARLALHFMLAKFLFHRFFKLLFCSPLVTNVRLLVLIQRLHAARTRVCAKSWVVGSFVQQSL